MDGQIVAYTVANTFKNKCIEMENDAISPKEFVEKDFIQMNIAVWNEAEL